MPKMNIKTLAKRKTLKQKKTLKNEGIEIDLPEAYDELEAKSVATIESILKKYPKAQKMCQILLYDEELRADWDMADFVAVTKLNFNDHGEIHAKVVAASALSMLKLLIKHGIKPEVVTSGAGDEDDAFLVVLTAALLHDIGNQVHRENHGTIGIYIGLPLLNRLLPEIYPDIEKRNELRAFILSAMHTHDGDPAPLTIEAGLVCVGDATDMTKGRGRLAFDLGNINIHTVSALSIENVSILEGKEKPIIIVTEMVNSAAIFQVEETLGAKVNVGPLADYIDVVATTQTPGDFDKKIVYGIKMEGKRFKPYGLKKRRKQ